MQERERSTGVDTIAPYGDNLDARGRIDRVFGGQPTGTERDGDEPEHERVARPYKAARGRRHRDAPLRLGKPIGLAHDPRIAAVRSDHFLEAFESLAVRERGFQP